MPSLTGRMRDAFPACDATPRKIRRTGRPNVLELTYSMFEVSRGVVPADAAESVIGILT